MSAFAITVATASVATVWNVNVWNTDQNPLPLTGATVGSLDGGGVITTPSGEATVQFNLGTGPSGFFRAEEQR